MKLTRKLQLKSMPVKLQPAGQEENCKKSAGTEIFRLMLSAFLLIIPPSASGGAQVVEESLLTGATLSDMSLEHEALTVFLDILKSSPGDKRALAAVKELAARSAASAGEISTAAVGDTELDNILDDAALEMLKEVREPELRLGFAKARRLFSDGQLLLAYDVLRLLESRSPSQDWLRAEIRRYLRERVPREMERRRAGGLYGINPDAYCRDAFRDLGKGRWEGVYRNLRSWLSISAAGKLPEGDKLQKEAELLTARMKSRAALSQAKESGEPWLGEARQYFLKQDYAGAVNMLEAFIPVSGEAELSARAWKELAIVYNYNALMELVEKAESAMSREQYFQASVLTATAQEQYPGNRKVVELMGALLEKTRGLAQKQREERPEKTHIAAVQAPPVKAASQPPARKAAVKIPTAKEKAEADSLYLEGISAYATGDIAKARSNWSAALELVPDHPKSKKALERLAMEIK